VAKALSDNYTEIVVLCEDRQQWVFVHRFLTKNGVHHRRIRWRPVPQGRGSGEQFVREQYPIEVTEHRKRNTRLNIALVVMQDCDTRTLQERRAALEGPQHREPDEKIVTLLPRRNIETWIRFLTDGDAVEETVRYPKLSRESDCHEAVDRLAAKQEYHLSPNVPDSLRAACLEIRRIFPAKRCIEFAG
jgi:hypothetical protein